MNTFILSFAASICCVCTNWLLGTIQRDKEHKA